MPFFIKAAEVWQPDLDGEHLVLSSAHYGDFQVEEIEEFRQASQWLKFSIDEGLPGKTWAERRPLIWTDLTLPHFKRKQLAEIAGLACGLSIPVFAGEFLQAVVVLFFAAGDEVSGAVEVWQNRDYYDNELQLRGGYYGKLEKFEWVSKRLTILRGHGLPGLAWKKRSPAILTDLAESSSFLRASHAAECGLNTGLAIPFFYTNRDVQVAVFLSNLSTPVARRFEVWRPDGEHRYLLFSSGFCSGGNDLKVRYRGIAYARGESPLGKVWLSGRPRVEDLGDNQRGVFLPFIVDGILYAVISFIF